MIIPTPMPLGQQSEPFEDPDWLYEIKHDGFRALALIDRGHCWFVSRRKHSFMDSENWRRLSFVS
jgi:bifunctional non-homologous end joining protein LigD